MQPFYTVYSPAEIALNLIFDAIWCIGWLIGFGIATVQYFAAPVPPQPKRRIIEPKITSLGQSDRRCSVQRCRSPKPRGR
jgi:hypothetical protein